MESLQISYITNIQYIKNKFMRNYNQQLDGRSLNNPSLQISIDQVKKVFQVVMNNLKGDWDKWGLIFQKFISEGYDDLDQAKLARVSDLLTLRVQHQNKTYKLDGKESIYLYLELQKEFRKQQNCLNQFYPTKEEIQTISEEGLNSLLRQPAEIRFQSSQKNNLPLNLIILFGPQNSGKTTFISACINFIRGLEYHSLLRYTVQKNERVIRIDNANEQLCFIKAQSFTNPYENKDFATKLIEVLEQEAQGRQLASFSILYLAISTQTRIGLAEKYQIQKLLELIPQKMQKFFIVKTFCTDDKANMTLFTGKESPAHTVPKFIEQYVLYGDTPNQKNYKKLYIFNNKLLSYEYKNYQNYQNGKDFNQINQSQPRNNPQNLNIQQQEEINLEQDQFLGQLNMDQMFLSGSVLQDLTLDDVDTTNIYWQRNKKNYEMLSIKIKQLQPDQCIYEFNQFRYHLKNLQNFESQMNNFMSTKKHIMSKQKLVIEKIDELLTVKTIIKDIYISINSGKMNISYSDHINTLICTQCEQICHRACNSIQDDITKEQYDITYCNRFKQGFCKHCFKKNNSYCKPVKHKLIQKIYYQNFETTDVKFNTDYFITKELIKDKNQKIKQVRLLQMDLFNIKNTLSRLLIKINIIKIKQLDIQKLTFRITQGSQNTQNQKRRDQYIAVSSMIFLNVAMIIYDQLIIKRQNFLLPSFNDYILWPFEEKLHEPTQKKNQNIVLNICLQLFIQYQSFYKIYFYEYLLFGLNQLYSLRRYQSKPQPTVYHFQTNSLKIKYNNILDNIKLYYIYFHLNNHIKKIQRLLQIQQDYQQNNYYFVLQINQIIFQVKRNLQIIYSQDIYQQKAIQFTKYLIYLNQLYLQENLMLFLSLNTSIMCSKNYSNHILNISPFISAKLMENQDYKFMEFHVLSILLYSLLLACEGIVIYYSQHQKFDTPYFYIEIVLFSIMLLNYIFLCCNKFCRLIKRQKVFFSLTSILFLILNILIMIQYILLYTETNYSSDKTDKSINFFWYIRIIFLIIWQILLGYIYATSNKLFNNFLRRFAKMVLLLQISDLIIAVFFETFNIYQQVKLCYYYKHIGVFVGLNIFVNFFLNIIACYLIKQLLFKFYYQIGKDFIDHHKLRWIIHFQTIQITTQVILFFIVIDYYSTEFFIIYLIEQIWINIQLHNLKQYSLMIQQDMASCIIQYQLQCFECKQSITQHDQIIFFENQITVFHQSCYQFFEHQQQIQYYYFINLNLFAKNSQKNYEILFILILWGLNFFLTIFLNYSISKVVDERLHFYIFRYIQDGLFCSLSLLIILEFIYLKIQSPFIKRFNLIQQIIVLITYFTSYYFFSKFMQYQFEGGFKEIKNAHKEDYQCRILLIFINMTIYLIHVVLTQAYMLNKIISFVQQMSFVNLIAFYFFILSNIFTIIFSIVFLNKLSICFQSLTTSLNCFLVWCIHLANNRQHIEYKESTFIQMTRMINMYQIIVIPLYIIFLFIFEFPDNFTDFEQYYIILFYLDQQQMQFFKEFYYKGFQKQNELKQISVSDDQLAIKPNINLVQVIILGPLKNHLQNKLQAFISLYMLHPLAELCVVLFKGRKSSNRNNYKLKESRVQLLFFNQQPIITVKFKKTQFSYIVSLFFSFGLLTTYIKNIEKYQFQDKAK
ncbi:hypothetical protein pb186bvf_015213 [Paramecium bursaria]